MGAILFALGVLASQAECSPAHAGMTCVPAAKATVGAGWARRDVALDRFWLDVAAVGDADFARCVADSACVALPASAKGDEGDEGDEGNEGDEGDETALLDWQRAESYCAWAGKRLPSEAEWEAAAQRSAVGTEVVWTHSWLVTPATLCRNKPGAPLEEESAEAWARAQCGERDVMDPCDGAIFCGKLGRRIVKDPAKPTKRRGRSWWTDKRFHATRCATSVPYLTSYPALATTTPLPAPSVPAPPTATDVAKFARVHADTVEVPECDEPGRSYLDCRDPRSYLKSNEPLLGVVTPYVKNRGGGYTGVGSDQQYTLIAHARPSWAWLFDYDEHVVHWHHVLRALILAAPDRTAFLAFFDGKEGVKRGVEALAARYEKRGQRRTLQRLWRGAAPPLASHYNKQATDPALSWSWLGSDERYAYIRTLYQQDRMVAFLGNMLEKDGMRTVGDAARALDVPIRVYYPSNAPEFWELTEQYRKNVLGLPFDEHSVVVQTLSGVSMKTGFGQTGYWHYNVQYGLEHHRLLGLPGFTRHKQLIHHRIKSESPELTLSGLPSSAPP